MIKHFKITLLNHNTTFKVSYKAEKFYKLEKLTGKLTPEQLTKLGAIVPFTTSQIDDYCSKHSAILTITPIVKQKSMYSQFSDAWFAFYDQTHAITPRFNAAEGKALKSIISYLVDLTQSEAEALELWRVILSSWQTLPDFFRNQSDLKFINSQINKIIIHVKGNNPSSEQSFKSAVSSEAAKGFRFR